jgi:hypothetical protein
MRRQQAAELGKYNRDFRFARFCDRGLADRRRGWSLKRRQAGNQPPRQLMKKRKGGPRILEKEGDISMGLVGAKA